MSKRKGPPLTWEEIRHYPGLFTDGSDAEQALLRHKQFQEEDRRTHPRGIAISGPLVQAGLVDAEFDPAWSAWIPDDWAKNDRIILHYDMETMVKIDWRLRFCRCLLDMMGRPFDREPVVLVKDNEGTLWSYKSETRDEDLERGHVIDPLERLLQTEMPYSAQWYAAKILHHAQRAERLSEEAKTSFGWQQDFGLAREWMLFGETWAEANFVINYGDGYLTEFRQSRARRRGHETVHGTDKEKAEKWKLINDDLQAELQTGTKKTAAYAIVAERHGVSAKTVERTQRYLKKS